jgi:hypothetical protein
VNVPAKKEKPLVSDLTCMDERIMKSKWRTGTPFAISSFIDLAIDPTIRPHE